MVCARKCAIDAVRVTARTGAVDSRSAAARQELTIIRLRRRREGHIMRVVTGIAFSTFLLTTALFAGMGRAAEKAAATSFSARDLQAKLEYCKTCHGLSGQG